MGNHVLRPHYVVMGMATLIVAAQYFAVPEDFGIGSRGYMYAWHRQGDSEEWKAIKPKFLGSKSCAECHGDETDMIKVSAHKIIQCESCHGPGLGHPEPKEALLSDRRKGLCLRCHFPLDYKTSHRADLPAIDPKDHNPEDNCIDCHNPHSPRIEDEEAKPATGGKP